MFFLFENSTNAINYDTTPAYPLYDSGGVLIGNASTYYDGQSSIFYAHPYGDGNYDLFSFFCINRKNSNGWVYYQSSLNSEYYSPGQTTPNKGINYFASGGNVDQYIIDKDGNTVYSTVGYVTWDGDSNYGSHKDDAVMCSVEHFIYIAPGSPKSGLWIRASDRYVYFGNETIHDVGYYTGTNASNRDEYYGVRLNSDGFISPKYNSFSWRINFTNSDWLNDQDEKNAKAIKEYLSMTGSTGLYVSSPLPWMYGTTNLVEAGSGTTGSGGIDYYADCTSLLDVGCYIKGSYNAIKGFFTGLVPSIAWSGSMESCAGSGVITQSGILAPLTDLIALLNPFPPPEGTMVCTLLGTSEIKYHVLVPEHNFWEVYGGNQVPQQLKTDMFVAGNQTVIDVLAMFVFTVLVFTTLHKKND